MYLIVKNILDLFISLALLIFLLPIFIIVSILIKSTSKGPIFIKQERTGKDMRPFTLYKFRTMIHTENGAHIKYLKKLIDDELGSGPVFKIKNDPRITHVGKFLRQTSLDQLPQLLNILKGDMSLVGPRPMLSYEISHISNEQQKEERFKCKPGITGLAQLNMGRISFEDEINKDIEYIRSRSLRLDLKILSRTVVAVLTKQGAY